MNEHIPGPIPRIPFDRDEVQGIEQVLTAYLHYLRRLPASPKTVKQRRAVEGLRQRLAVLLSAGYVRDVQLFLTRDDLDGLVEALREFALLVQRFFPKNEERETVIETVTTWRRRITRILADFQA